MIRQLILCVFLAVIVGCTAEPQEATDKQACTTFYDCLPSGMAPGDTGCGGCHKDEAGQVVCYELDEQLCDEYKQNYTCLNNVCVQ